MQDKQTLSSATGNLLAIFRVLARRFANSLGVRLERKEEIYLDLSRAATLRDASYWLQIIFAAGVATLGLALNSPAVIIGAMLISPLMGPILSAGLALATGDLILGIRAAAALALSCLVAVLFAILLVSLLPFREMTAEIAARTQPNTLDLVVALFSGAIGSIATCKEVKGIVTSIPGVAIAVALMPPLCVVGYGIGLSVTNNGGGGLRVAGGGGLLFLTNLVAISLMAMVVFLIVNIGVKPVTEKVREWRRTDPESQFVQQLLERFHLTEKLREIGGARARFLLILVPLLLILIPLSSSLGQLRQEYLRQRQENQLRSAIMDLWQQNFGRLPSGQVRSDIDQLTFEERDGRLAVYLRVFTNQPYTASERNEWTRLLAARLNRPAETINLQLIDIPTTAAELASRAREEKRPPAPPTVSQLQANYWEGVEAALRGVRFPPTTQLIDYRVSLGSKAPARVVLSYLCDTDIGTDAQALITEDIRTRMTAPESAVSFEKVPVSFGPITFRRNQSALPLDAQGVLDAVAEDLKSHGSLRLEIIAQAEKNEPEKIAEARAQAILDYLVKTRLIAKERVSTKTGEDSDRTARLRLQLANAAQ